MSLKIKTATRLRALFPGVSLSKKSVEALGDQFAKAGLTDESTDEEIDTKLNERNALFSFEDQKKFDDYQTGKAAKEKADKEAADKKAAEEEKGSDTPPADETPTEKLLRQALAGITALTAEVASIKGEKVATTRKEQYAKALEGTSEVFKNKALKDFGKMKFDTDEEFSEWLNEASEDAKGFIQEEANEGLGGDKPAGSGGKAPKAADKEISPAMKELIAERKAAADAKAAQTI